ncbi:hypothetical protein H0H92_013959 [Tricholoma furcatifolium]|nr:hypothetical protein H0H92_013959 [Tricholoma furcatifolium]
MTTPNSLGLDFEQLKIQDTDAAQSDTALQASPQSAVVDPKVEKIDKKKPYVNAERVKTGGIQRDKLSDEALAERMARIREQNEKIKQRRLDVQADEDAFRKTQEAERVKIAHNRKVQEGVDRTREQNAKRKMDKIQSREWDSGKPTGDWKQHTKKTEDTASLSATEDTSKSPTAVELAASPRDSGNWVRGNLRGGPHRGRGRGRGRGGVASTGTQQRDITENVEAPQANIPITEPSSTEQPKDTDS